MKFKEYFGILYEAAGGYGKPRSSPLSKEQFEILYQTHCKEYIPGKNTFYRGNRAMYNSAFTYADPRYSERASANTQSYIMWIIETMPEWREYPLRSKSFICSSSSRRAGDYSRGGGGAHIVIPFDGAELGICPYDDFWDSFKLKSGNNWVDAMNNWLDNIFNQYGYTERSQASIDTGHAYNRFTKREFLNILNSIPYAILDKSSSGRGSWLSQVGSSNRFNPFRTGETYPKHFNFLENIKKMLSPEDNGFKHMPVTEYDSSVYEKGASDGFGGGHELWISHRCLFLNPNQIHMNPTMYLNNLRYIA